MQHEVKVCTWMCGDKHIMLAFMFRVDLPEYVRNDELRVKSKSTISKEAKLMNEVVHVCFFCVNFKSMVLFGINLVQNY